MKHWQGPQKDTVSVEADFDDLSHGVEIGAAVRAEYAFWLPGSTGGVVHGEGSFFVVDNAQQWIGARGGEELLVGVVCLAGVGDADKLELSEVEFGDLRVERFVDEEEARAGVGEDMRDFIGL